MFATNLEGSDGPGRRHRRLDRRPARRRRRPGVRVHAAGGEPRAPARVRAARASRPRSSRRPATARRARRPARPRTSSWRSPTSSASCSPVPTGRASCRRRSQLCAQIVAPYPPAGRIGVASQSRQLRVDVHELRGRRPASASAARSRPATPPRSPWPTTSTSIADDDATAVGLAYVEGIADGRAFFDAMRRR